MKEPKKLYIDPIGLRKQSFMLGKKVIEDGFKPDFLVALWRGGAPVGMYTQELLKYKGIKTDHIAIRTSRYTGIDVCEGEVQIHGLEYLIKKVKEGNSILLCDDVWDSGRSIDAFLEKLKRKIPYFSTLDVRVATLYYKPTRNKSKDKPRYFVEETDEWLVFPHELEGMTIKEIREVMGDEIADIIQSC